MEQLKPCPYCGDQPKMKKRLFHRWWSCRCADAGCRNQINVGASEPWACAALWNGLMERVEEGVLTWEACNADR